MEQTEKKIHPGIIIASVVAVVIMTVLFFRSGGSITGERAANDITKMIPEKREETLPPPPGFQQPTNIATMKKGK